VLTALPPPALATAAAPSEGLAVRPARDPPASFAYANQTVVVTARNWDASRAAVGTLAATILAPDGGTGGGPRGAFWSYLAEGAAQRLASWFQEVSLANGEAAQVLERLATAQTAAAGALEAARALGSKAPAAKDVEARLEPVTGAVAEALTVLGRYRQLQAGYGEQLALEGAGKSPEEQLADAVHRSGRVVLGSFTLTQTELDQLKTGEADRGRKLLEIVKFILMTLNSL
jgi:hypothetical protein